MKKNNEVLNVNENMVENTVVAEPIMDEQQMQQYVEQNKHLVPRNQAQKFNVLTLEKQVSKISFYLDMQKMREDAKERNKIINKVKELFDKRHASVDEQTVIEDVKRFLESKYGCRLKWFVIEDEDEEIIYDSQE